jgi:hypothetical protein
MPENERIILA